MKFRDVKAGAYIRRPLAAAIVVALAGTTLYVAGTWYLAHSQRPSSIVFGFSNDGNADNGDGWNGRHPVTAIGAECPPALTRDAEAIALSAESVVRRSVSLEFGYLPQGYRIVSPQEYVETRAVAETWGFFTHATTFTDVTYLADGDWSSTEDYVAVATVQSSRPVLCETLRRAAGQSANPREEPGADITDEDPYTEPPPPERDPAAPRSAAGRVRGQVAIFMRPEDSAIDQDATSLIWLESGDLMIQLNASKLPFEDMLAIAEQLKAHRN